MKRRDFIKITAGGLAVTAMGTVLDLPPLFRRGVAHAAVTVNLDMVEVEHEMVDTTLVYSWAFAVGGVPGIPGPVVFVRENDTITFNITNSLPSPRSFAIRNNNQQPIVVNTGPIAQNGGTAQVTINPNTLAPGTYIYEDLQDSPIGRVMGLHGVLVVMPASQPGAKPNPYGTKATSKIIDLFDDFGVGHFPGVPWNPLRQVIWVFSEVYPRLNQAVLTNGGVVPSGLLNTLNNIPLPVVFIPEYFTFNGRSGYFSSNDHHHIAGTPHINLPIAGGVIQARDLDTVLYGDAGDPILIRNVHVGLDTHSPHIHANHGYILAVDGDILGGANPGGLWWVDTWTMLPGNRKDVLYPMMVPPDIPEDTWNKLKIGAWHPDHNPTGSQELMALKDLTKPGEILNDAHQFGDHDFALTDPQRYVGKFTHLVYPMHSHQEISQSAAGGNYPMGLITHIEFTGAKPGV